MVKYKFGRELRERGLSGRSNWQVCNQLLFEEAVWFFMKNHQMDEMIGNCENMRRHTHMLHRGFDFEAEELCMEMKVFMSESDAGYSNLGQRLQQSIKQVIEYVMDSSGLDVKDKRIILFVVGRQGISEAIKTLIGRGTDRLLKRAMDMKIELWVAEMGLEPGDGICLLSYENITNDISELN